MARTDLVTSAEVLRTAHIDDSSQIDSDIVDDAIDEAQEEVYNDYGDPPKKSYFFLDNNHTKYAFRNDNKRVYRIDKVIVYDSDNNRITYTASESASETNHTYVQDLEFNTITFAQATVTAYSGQRCEVNYTPYNIYSMARTKAALYLIDYTNTSNNEDNSPTLGTRLIQRIKRLEESIRPVEAAGSEEEKGYNPSYGDFIPQRRFWTFN